MLKLKKITGFKLRLNFLKKFLQLLVEFYTWIVNMFYGSMSIPFLDDVTIAGNLSASGSLSATNYFGSGKFLTDINISTSRFLPLSGGTLSGSLTTLNLTVSGNTFVQQGMTVVGHVSTAGNLYGNGDNIVFSQPQSPTNNKAVRFIGDDVNTLYTVQHNLGSEDVVTSVYDRVTKEMVLVSNIIIDSNNIRFEFTDPPGIATGLDLQGRYKIVVLS